MKLVEIEKIPTWAVGYLMYGEGEAGLEDEDLRLVKDWEAGHPGLRFVDAAWDTKDDFSPYPEFGDACETVTCVFEDMN